MSHRDSPTVGYYDLAHSGKQPTVYPRRRIPLIEGESMPCEETFTECPEPTSAAGEPKSLESVLESALKRPVDKYKLDRVLLKGGRVRSKSTLDSLRGRPDTERAWRARKPVRAVKLEGRNTLVLHPPTGAWAIVAADGFAELEAILRSPDEGLLDDIPDIENRPVIQGLMKCGLLERSPVSNTARSNRSKQRSLRLLILKTVGYCNLACRYCYDYNDTTYRRKLDVELGKRAIEEALASATRNLSILFHGGEPLLAFDEIRALTKFAKATARRLGKEVNFSVQTNGTCFTGEIVDFLVGEEFAIGLSLDGPAELNDLVRVDRRGKGCHASVEASLDRYPILREIAGVLTTVTRINARHLARVAEYVRDLGIRSFNAALFLKEGRGIGASDNLSPSADELIAGYVDLLDGVESGQFDSIQIWPILHYLRNVLRTDVRGNACLRNGGCGAARELVSVSVNGTIESCDCVRIPELRLGSMSDSTIGKALDGEVADLIRSRSESSLPRCSLCLYRAYCGGTCFARAGALSEVNECECRLSRAMFGEIFQRLNRSDRLERYAQMFS